MATDNPYESPPSLDADVDNSSSDALAAPVYFPVSPLKLIVMSICTIGIYEVYWYYKNWSLIKEREKLDIRPFWRALFAFFFCYSCFKEDPNDSAVPESDEIYCGRPPGCSVDNSHAVA